MPNKIPPWMADRHLQLKTPPAELLNFPYLRILLY